MCLVTQSCLTLCIPMDCSPPGSSVHRILQARILEWVARPSPRGYSQPRDQTPVSHITGSFLFFCFYQLSHQGSLHNSSGDAENVGGYAYVKAGSLL